MSIIEKTPVPTTLEACDGNWCAATLLDYFYKNVSLNAPTGIDSQNTVVSLDDLGTVILNRFSRDNIYRAIWFLERRKYIWTVIHLYGWWESRLVKKNLIRECICYRITDAGIELFRDLRAKTQQQHEISLARKYKTESARVMYHNKRAEEFGSPATLTLTQWIQTLEHFDWKCAYCQGKYTVLEHYVPLGYEEGTVWTNCVPACHSCNSAKGPYHPKAFPSKMMKKWGRIFLNIEQYLETRRDEAE